MLLMPLSGWLLASASPVQDLLQMQNMVFGRFALPDPFVPGGDAHRARRPAPCTPAPPSPSPRSLALHAAAALKHQFVDRDGLLARMTSAERNAAPRRGAAAWEPAAGQTVCGAWRLAMNWSNSAWSLAARSWSRKRDEGVALLLEPLQRLLAIGVEGGVAGAAAMPR